MQAFYFDETPILSNEEFDNLKDELLWAGSKVAVLRWAPALLVSDSTWHDTRFWQCC